MRKAVVIGGGASGMLAAVYAARGGASVEIYEQNEKLERSCISREKAGVI